MKTSYLLFIGCLFYVSVYDVRGNVQNIIQEFNYLFKEYVNQNSSSMTCFNSLKNHNVCPCAIEQLQKIQDGFYKQNSTEVDMMKKNLQALIDQLTESGKSKDPTKQPGKTEECQFMCVNPESAESKIHKFFRKLRTRKCFKGSR